MLIYDIYRIKNGTIMMNNASFFLLLQSRESRDFLSYCNILIVLIVSYVNVLSSSLNVVRW